MSSKSRATHRRSMQDAYDTYREIIHDTVIKKQKIKDILHEPELLQFSRRICRQRLAHLPPDASDKVCTCLNEKNGEMTVADLEEKTSAFETTPGSECITLYDTLVRKSQPTKSHTKSSRKLQPTKSHTKSSRKSHTKSSRKSHTKSPRKSHTKSSRKSHTKSSRKSTT